MITNTKQIASDIIYSIDGFKMNHKIKTSIQGSRITDILCKIQVCKIVREILYA